ncbi:hypothetical protein GJ689_21525 [Rhodoplanes serenus]|uniref:Schlafen AlbA-2 domain-containing protein n=1 Tax=Rhodoplanes serenus TaxID=200615 RepID=A0A9X5AUV0_9BRAD|nr:RNA-binding domain-containing protein [Rhodoplanes serenus]MTW18785.1 hypothetical protein [Rhodoplanes serenus]
MAFEPTRISELLLSPTEELAVEIKEWLVLSENEHKAKLAQAIIALANHGGGTIIIGFEQLADGRFSPATPRPAALDAYSTDGINNISSAYLRPPIHCAVTMVSHPTSGEEYPVISVPGGHRVPIMAARGGPQDKSTLKSGRVYIRKPGPKSEEPGGPDEWQALFDRCIRNGSEDLLDRFRAIMAGGPTATASVSDSELLDRWIKESMGRWSRLLNGLPPKHPARFPLGHYRFAYQLKGPFERPNLRQLLEALRNAQVRHSGWPNWPIIERDPIRPYPVDDVIEAFLVRDKDAEQRSPDTLDFWRVSADGKAFMIRGLNEDSHPDLQEPGKHLDITTPTWRLADGLTHAANLARELKLKDGFVDFDLQWSGLSERELNSIGNPRRVLFSGHKTHQKEYTARLTVPLGSIRDTLPEIVDKALRPMYERFDFFELPATLTAEEIAYWRRNAF